LNGRLIPIYGTHKVRTRVADSKGRERDAEDLFCTIDLEDYDMVLGYPWLQTRNPDVDWAGSQWGYSKNPEPPEVLEDEEFAEAALETGRIYAVRYTPLQPVEGVVPELQQEYAEFADVFSEAKAVTLPPLGGPEHAIELEGGEPPYGPIYNLSERELKVLREYLRDAMERGWIRESNSAAGAPILFMPKKGGELHLCVDYRGLNRITRKNRYPLPLMSEILNRVVSTKRYTKIDLRNVYHRIRIWSGDEWKTAFRTRYGQFEYQVLPFGLANTPATFQTYMNQALRGLVDITCVVYLDDILIFSVNPEDHHRHVAEVLRRLRKYGLYAKLSKCQFGVNIVDFLGYVLSPGGVAMECSWVDMIAEWPEPKSFRDIQIFLGFANFYRRFIAKFSRIARPLSDLLKESKDGKKSGPFRLTEPAKEAFRVLKEAFNKAPVLLHFDLSKPIHLVTDASGFAIYGILHQL
jgi:Reverse transcriptase (RNA-dependent DNA polymerase)/RNase H-like domain found in reverse transcriptase